MFVLFVTHNICLDYELMYTRMIYFLMVHKSMHWLLVATARHRIIGKARVHVLSIRAEF